jgi:hypothetical protein
MDMYRRLRGSHSVETAAKPCGFLDGRKRESPEFSRPPIDCRNAVCDCSLFFGTIVGRKGWMAWEVSMP